ncbi:MAG: FlgD immunoglobulin-like domain containing protein, partial [Candidatus Cloacimonadota bacterium]
LFIGFNCDNNAITNNVFEATESAVHLWRGGNQTITGNTLTGAEIGLRLKASNDNTIQNNTITGNEVGLNTGGTLDYGPSEDNLIIQNRIYGNSVYGAQTLEGSPLDLTRNYWGSQYGPEHATNPFSGAEGIGNAVSDNITFMPFYATATTTPETEYVNVVKDTRATYMVFTTDDLTTALAAAVAGDDIQLGTFNFVGSFDVPANVTIIAQAGETPTVTANGGAAFEINGGGVLIDGITVVGAADYPAVLVTVNDADNPATIIDCDLNNDTGATLVNESGVDALIEGNYWNDDDPNDPTIVVGQGSPVVVLEEEETLPIALYSFAEDTLLKAGETQSYTVKALQAEDLAGYTVRIQLDKTYFTQPTDFAMGAGFLGDEAEPFLDDLSTDTHWIYDVSAAYNDQIMVSGYNVPLFSFESTSLAGADEAPRYAVSPIALIINNVVLMTVDNGQYNVIVCEECASVDITLDWADPTITHTNADTYTSPYLLHVNSDGSGNLVIPTLNFTFADNYNQDFCKYIIQAASLDTPGLAGFEAAEFFAAIDGTTTDVAWVLPDEAYADNTYSLYVLTVDDAGNFSIFDWDFIVDRTAPGTITWAEGSAACRTTINANNSIDLNFTNPAGAVYNHIWCLSYASLTGAGAYPTYNDASFTVPELPAAPNPYNLSIQNGWTSLGYTMATSTWTHINMPRGYYYYMIFVEDASGNIGAGSSVKESISYWPGDVSINNAVDLDDVAALAAVWGTDGSGNTACNVGPTVDRLRRGRPLPDTRINIEDLMIFAMNYGNTDYEPYDRTLPEINPIRIEMITEAVDNRLLVHLVMSENNGFVRALNIPVSYSNGLTLQSAELGNIWPEDSILLHTNSDNVIELSMSGLGMETVVEGNGVVATLSFLMNGDTVETELLPMIARDVENNEIEIINNPTGGVDNDEEVIVIPATDFLGNAYPNPFNPTTTISYGITEAQNVRITVYNSRGQAVRTLVNANMPAGTYNIVWDGRDDSNRSVSSGLYFFRMESGNHLQIKKAILMK